MALTRKFLKALGIDDDKIDEIIAAHGDTVTALKDEIEKAKQEGEGLEAVTKERDKYKQDYEALQKTSGDASKVQAAFDAYKAEVAAEKLKASKGAALEAALKKAGVERESFRAQIRKGWNLDELELEDGGGAKDEAALIKRIQTDYQDFIGNVTTIGTPPATPPTGSGSDAPKTLLESLQQRYNKK